MQYLSASQIRKYISSGGCEEEDAIRMGYYILRGIHFHAAVASAFIPARNHREGWGKAMSCNYFMERIQNYLCSRPINSYSRNRELEQMADILRLSNLFYKNFFDMFGNVHPRPLFTEKKFKQQLNPYVCLSAKPDAVFVDFPEVVIWDWKTGEQFNKFTQADIDLCHYQNITAAILIKKELQQSYVDIDTIQLRFISSVFLSLVANTTKKQ